MTSRESSEPEVPPTRKIITADEYDKARSREFSPYMDFALVEGDKPIVTSEFTCPICLDLLFKTVTAKDCLHRFCSDCINMALHKGNRECPTCRSKIISKRDLRSDKRFDAIVKAMWPDRQEYARIVREYEEANQKESTDYYRAQENSHASSLMEDIRNMAIPVNASDPDMEPDESRAKKLVSKFHKAVDILYENGDLEQCLNVIGTCRPSLNNRKSNMEGSDEESLNSPTALLRTVSNYNSLEEVLEANPLYSKDDEEEEEEDEEEANSSLDGSDTKLVSKIDESNRMEPSDAPAETRGLKRKHKEQNKDEVQLIKNAEPDTKKVKSEELLQADASTSQCGLQSMKNDIDEQQGTQSSLQVTQNFPQTSKSYYAQTTSGQAFVISKKAIKSIKAQDRDDHEANDDEEEEEYEDEEDDEDEEEYDEEEDDDETEVNNDSRVLPKRIVTIRKDGRLTEAEKRYHNYARRTQGLLFQTGLVGSIGVARPPGVIQNIGAAANMEDLRNPTSVKHLKILQRRLSGHSSEDSEGDEFDENEEDEEEYEELDKYNEEKSGVQLDVNEVNGGQEKKLDYYNDEKNEEEEYDIEDLVRLTQAHHDDLQRMYIRNFLAGLLDSYEDKNLRWKVNFRQLFMEDPPECKISDTFFAYVCKRRFTYINENPEFSAYYYMMKNINYSDKWNRQNSLFYDLMFGDRTLNGIDDKFETAYKKEILDFSHIKDSHEYGNYDIFYNESEEDEFAGIETDEDRDKISEEGGYEGESTVRFKPFTQPLDLGISSCSSSEDEKTRQIAKKKISKNRYYVSKHARREKAFHFDEVVGFMNENAMLERDKYLKKKAAQRNLKKSSGEESKEYSGEDTSDSDEEAKDTREKSSVAENGASNKDVVSENVPGEPDCMDVDIVDEDEGNEADNEDNSDEDLELTGDSERSENLSDDSEDETQRKNDEFWLDRLTREAKKKVSNLPRGSPESSDIGTESDRETAYHLNRCGLPKVSREFMEYIKHSRLWYTILKHPYNKAKLCLKRSAKFYLRAWRDTLSGVYDPAAIRGEELIPEDPDVALPKVFFEYNTFFKSRPVAAVKRYWRSDVLIKPEYAASNRSMCHVDTIMKRSNYLGLDEYIDDEEIYVNPELYGESNCSESYDSEIDDDEYHDSGKYREDVDNIIKNHNFSEILQGLPDFEKNDEVMTALNNLRDLVIQYKRTRTNCLDFMSSILPMNSPLSYFRVADCDLQYAAEVYKPLFVEDKALFRKHNRVVEVDDEESEEYSSNSDDSECYENYHYAEDVEEPEEADYRESSEVQTNSNDGVVENDEMEIGDNFNKSEDCGGTKEPEENDSYKMISSERMEICEESVKSVNSGEDSSSEYEDVVDDEAEDFQKETENMTSEQREKLLLELVNEIEKEISEVCGKQLNDSDLEEHISDRSEEDSLDSSEEESETENESDSVEETTSEEDSTEVSDAESDAPTINEDADEKMEVISAECSNREVLKQPEHLNAAAEEDSDSMSEEESDQNSEISSQNDSDDLSEDFFVETSEQELGDETDDTSEVTSDESSDDSDDSTGESSYEGVFGEEIESCSEESDGTSEEECGSSLELSNNLDDIEDEESECTVDSDGDSLTESDENSDAMATEESDGNSIEDTGETSVDDFERQSRNTSEEDSEDADDASEEEYGSSEGESELEPEEEEEKLEVSDETYPKLSCDSDMHDGYNKNDDEEDAEMELDDDVSDEEIEDEDFDEPSEQSEYEEPEIVDELVNETVRVFKKRLQKVNKDGYVSLDEEDEEDLYGEQEEDVYVTNMGTIRNTVARKMTRKPESTKEDETVYDEKWDYTHGNMEYEKLKEDVDAFDLKSRPTILDAFKTRRIYDPVNFNARKNFALVPLYDDYGLKSYMPDPREDASSVQAIINSTY